MKLLIHNSYRSLCLTLNVLRSVGYLVPDDMNGCIKIMHKFYTLSWFMILVGIPVITQLGDLFQVWGNVSDMTNTSFLLFTNMAFTIKIFTLMIRREEILTIIREGEHDVQVENRSEGKKIIDSSDKEALFPFSLYSIFTCITCIGWLASAEKNHLPLRAWYPYDTSKSPAYELTYMYQGISVIIQAIVHVNLDQLVASLTAVCRCRLKLVNLSLRTICEGITITDKLLTEEEDRLACERLRSCIMGHQAVLRTAAQIQKCFTEPLLAQFTVSMIIICTTAYQLALETRNSPLRLISMFTYLMGMSTQVFIFCYQGNHLSEESSEISDAAYECPWYACSVSFRRALLFAMIRARRKALLTAGGFATLSLACFVSIIKASYSFFTVLKQMEE